MTIVDTKGLPKLEPLNACLVLRGTNTNIDYIVWYGFFFFYITLAHNKNMLGKNSLVRFVALRSLVYSHSKQPDGNVMEYMRKVFFKYL